MILDKIVAATRVRLERDKTESNLSLIQLEDRLPRETPRGFAAALKQPGRLGLIAEIKKASPSKGIIAEDFDAARQAQLYRDGGADCLSVLTEPEWFQGDLEHLKAARELSGLPCLRKDFIVDQWQIAQARLYGADCILLILSVLKDWEVRCFQAAAHRYGMDALAEVHDEEDARRAVANGCTFIGINNRDLRTFDVDLATTERLRPLLPEGATIVAESGVFTAADARRLRDAGADALLVGESLMKSADVHAAISALQNA